MQLVMILDPAFADVVAAPPGDVADGSDHRNEKKLALVAVHQTRIQCSGTMHEAAKVGEAVRILGVRSQLGRQTFPIALVRSVSLCRCRISYLHRNSPSGHEIVTFLLTLF